MINRKPTDREKKLDELIDEITNEMDVFGPLSEDYPMLLSELERLCKLRDGERRKPVDGNTAALVAGNIFATVLIVWFEHNNVMSSKAFSPPKWFKS
jgi:hypothetical protein